jgi:hypothetical protein
MWICPSIHPSNIIGIGELCGCPLNRLNDLNIWMYIVGIIDGPICKMLGMLGSNEDNFNHHIYSVSSYLLFGRKKKEKKGRYFHLKDIFI